MTATMITAIARHLLTTVGGAYAMKYDIDGASLDAIIGGVSALAGVVWSIMDKRKRS